MEPIPSHTPREEEPLGLRPAWRVLPPSAMATILVALVVSTQIQLSMMDHGHDWWRLFLWQLGGFGFWVLAAPWVIASGVRWLRPESRPAFFLLREAGKALVLGFVHLPFVTTVFVLLQPYDPVATYSFQDALLRAFRTWPQIDILIYGTVVAVGCAVESHRRARRSELRRSQLDAELARAQLESLRLQIQPHFLFNSLHSIASLLRRRRNDRALEMLLGLSELLRATLERSNRVRIPLHEELGFLRLYVDLQRIRFADRLSVDYDVGEECLEQPVPTLLLQPLVENAIRHGIAPRAAPGHVKVLARVEDGRLDLTVEDDGVGLPDGFETGPEGVGLSNTRSRIRRLHGGDASLIVRRREGGGTIVVVSWPAEPVEAPLQMAVA